MKYLDGCHFPFLYFFGLFHSSLLDSVDIKLNLPKSPSCPLKEQRLRYLKQQERRQQQTVSESEKLQRLKDRVENQEAKLKKIRAMRGQVDYSKVINGNLCKYSCTHYIMAAVSMKFTQLLTF